MRALVSRGLLVSPLVCAALVFGPAAATAAAADAGREASGTGVAQTALPPGTDVAALLARIEAMDTTRYHHALAPLLDTLPNLTTADGTALDPARAAAYAKEVREWSDALQKRLRQLDAGGTDRSARAADPVSDLLSAIQAAVNSLLSSLTSLDLGGVLGAVTGLLGSILDAVTGLLGAVPALPSLPAAGASVSTTTVAP
ncbi:hypothetical protein AB0D59_20080 [Streptomyces sp. NPDC048417]|uniref:hypothetical protein n=1 Tax=Streptomyces sp. NPDC048417 TaxID=3155387 RepID=UPI003443DEFE